MSNIPFDPFNRTGWVRWRVSRATWENNVMLFGVTEPEAKDGNSRKAKGLEFFNEFCTVALEIKKLI